MATKFDKESFNGIIKFLKHPAVVCVFLIFIAMWFSTHYRMYPADLPFAENAARQSIDQSINQQVELQISQQYPNLPTAEKQQLINVEVAKVKEAYKADLETNVQNQAAMIRSQLQDDSGQTYLLAIDPYLWYGHTKNYLDCGHVGCEKIVNESGTYYDTYRGGRVYRADAPTGMTYTGILIYKIMNLFNETSLLSAFFLIPVVLIGLAVIPAFFMARKIGGNFAGFISAIIVALNTSLLGRTPAGFSDTDASNVLFPLLIFWFLIEAFDAKSLKTKIIYGVSCALSFYAYSLFWETFHMFAIMGASIGLYIIIEFIKKFKKSNSIMKALPKKELILGGSIAAGLVILLSLMGRNYVAYVFNAIFNFISLKDVGVSSLWPNVFTTVAEFNVAPWGQVINQMGGKLLFGFVILGMLLAFVNIKKLKLQNSLAGLVVIVWFIATVYSLTKGMRFAVLLTPAFAVAAGMGVGLLHKAAMRVPLKLARVLITTLFVFVICIFVGNLATQAHAVAMGEIPSYNDQWDTTLNNIKADAEDGIGYITTWWDFGHWFVAKDIRVTFDGGDQGERIHWVGKMLLTPNEDTSVGILRMLNCGQNKAPHVIEEFVENDTIKAINILNDIFVLDKKEAKEVLANNGLTDLEQEEVLTLTHCEDLMPQYVIASEDMVGKAGVWGHFGAWDFNRAKMWQMVRGKSVQKGINILTDPENEFNLTEKEATSIYHEIQQTEADQWISPWPGYYSAKARCAAQNDTNTIRCENGAEIDMTTVTGTVYTQQGVVPIDAIAHINKSNEFEIVKGEEEGPFGALLFPDNTVLIVDPLHVGSMFTRMFYYEGHGLEKFKLFDDRQQIIQGGRIQTWKIDWNSTEARNVYSVATSPAISLETN